jgi:hypothetical protein
MWKFQRYEQVMEYEATPSLPPPFTFLCHVWLLVKYILGYQRMRASRFNWRGNDKEYLFDYGLSCVCSLVHWSIAK